jgi:hypothetical protein
MVGGDVRGRRDWLVKEGGTRFGIRVFQAGCFVPIPLHPGLEVELEQAQVICLVGHRARDLSMRPRRELAIHQVDQ